MLSIVYHPIRSAIREDKGALAGSTQPISVPCRYSYLCFEGCQAIHYFNIVFMGRSLFDICQPIGILGDEADSRVCLCEINLRCYHIISYLIPSTSSGNGFEHSLDHYDHSAR